MKILICEDEASIRAFLKINFERNGFSVIEAGSGEEALRLTELEKPHVAVLDVMLPGIDGFEVCRRLRATHPNIGIIMLTAKGQDGDKISGLEKGADDYVVKPFNPTEFILRTKALIRRLEEAKGIREDSQLLSSKGFTMDKYSQTLKKGEDTIELTPKEFAIMKIFLENEGKAFSRDELLNLVWGYDFVGDPKIVDVNMRRLRAKIEDNASDPQYIKTVWGTGYRWGKE
ncbi:response regulator transcription factor [Proteiniclasticum sp. BAD-10]|uniref:Stage 0 sporulation protein A homolog n=1 Tax=Proteiniclasticum sediminis TaxID=2804028 RepID=A0A941CQZ6_9CLOT|nr:response regulator transcription factor [Proteiniclasticum sediminis]MBR0575748.1 response regulator transcription factor [Proteiniclasticum sediminis]